MWLSHQCKSFILFWTISVFEEDEDVTVKTSPLLNTEHYPNSVKFTSLQFFFFFFFLFCLFVVRNIRTFSVSLVFYFSRLYPHIRYPKFLKFISNYSISLTNLKNFTLRP
jgi:hypothetical protein